MGILMVAAELQHVGSGRCARQDYPAAALNHAPPVVRGQSKKRAARSQRRTVLVQAVVAPPEKPIGTNLPAFEAWSTGAPVKKRTDLKTIMLLGAGPIVIGQVRHKLLEVQLMYDLG